MKRINLLVALFAMVFAMASCDDDDDKVTYDQAYRIVLNATDENELIGSTDEGLEKLDEFYGNQIKELEKLLKNGEEPFKITGRGETEELAIKNADEIAMKNFEEDLKVFNPKIDELKLGLEEKRKSLAAKILEDPSTCKFKVIGVGFILQKQKKQDDTQLIPLYDDIKTSKTFDFEAKGGVDYGQDEPVDE